MKIISIISGSLCKLPASTQACRVHIDQVTLYIWFPGCWYTSDAMRRGISTHDFYLVHRDCYVLYNRTINKQNVMTDQKIDFFRIIKD